MYDCDLECRKNKENVDGENFISTLLRDINKLAFVNSIYHFFW